MFAMVAASAACMSGAPRVASVQNKCALHTAVARDAPCGVATKAHKALATSALPMAAANAVALKDVQKLPSVAEGARPTVAGVDALSLGAVNMHKAARSAV